MASHTTTQDGVKAWPVHEEEHATNHRNQLTVVVATILTLGVLPGKFWLEEEGGSEAEVSTEHVDGHGTTNVNNLQNEEEDNRVQGHEEGLESGNHHELCEGCLTKEGTHGNQESSGHELGLKNSSEVDVDLIVKAIMESLVPEALEQDTSLHGPGSADVVDADGAPAVSLKEHHQEAETNKDHNVDVHPHWIIFSDFSCGLSVVLLEL